MSAGKVVLALDGMGGDHAPGVVVNGADIARERYPGTTFLLFGDPAQLKPLVDKRKGLAQVVEIVPAEDAVLAEDKPSFALRRRRKSSMWLACEAAGQGRADSVVSAGNTGALLAISMFAMRMLEGADRPALASFVPTMRGESVMLDLGANIECDAENLVQFALMGDAFARAVLGLTKPTIGLLNVGSEEMKGNDAVREASVRLKAGIPGITYHGFVEGTDITAGTVDVIVTDGFSGNIALKAMEGVAELLSSFTRSAFKSSLLAQIGYLFARPALKKMRDRLDPRRYNGAMLLGLNGIVVKSHGGSDAVGFANAIGVAVDLQVNGFLDQIREELAVLRGPEIPPQTATV